MQNVSACHGRAAEMPAAAPLPRTPSVLTLESADDLLTGPGCPVCRYASEASDRYLGWFALEAHADPVTLTRLCRSLGMCGRHARLLMSQPGAAVRLTAVHGYLVREARQRLSGRIVAIAPCPACEHDDAVAGRALDTLLEGLSSEVTRQRCRQFGGLCIPHLSAAARRGPRRQVAWLADIMAETVVTRTSGLTWLAGGFDQDAEARAVLSRSIPPVAEPGSYACVVCMAAAVVERDYLALVMTMSGYDLARPDMLLCSNHLCDAALLAGTGQRLTSLLLWQAHCQTARLSPSAKSRRHIRDAKSRTRGRRGRSADTTCCEVCLAQQAAAHQALDEFRHYLRQSGSAPQASESPMCVRHLLALRAADSWAGEVMAANAAARADRLVSELACAFDAHAKHHQVAAGCETGAWRRAAAFLDGSVFGGSPPRDR